MKPPMPYFGGKQMIAEQIVATFPRHDAYIEPYAGGLSVLFAKPLERMEVVNDLNRELVTFWRILRDQPDELLRRCELTPHSRLEFEQSATREGCDDLETARRVWVRMTQGRSAKWTATGWRFHTNGAKGGPATLPAYLDGYRGRLWAAAHRLMNVTLECRPALEIIEQYGAYEGNLLYLDPPYLGSTRHPGDVYGVEMADAAEHTAMLEAISHTKAAVVLSGYDSDTYAAALEGWACRRITATTQDGGNRTEVIWANRPVEDTLFGDWEDAS